MSSTTTEPKAAQLPEQVEDNVEVSSADGDWGLGNVECIGGGTRARVWTKRVAVPGIEDFLLIRILYHYPESRGVSCELYRDKDDLYIDLIESVNFDEKLPDHKLKQEAKRLMQLIELGSYTDEIVKACKEYSGR